MIFSLPFFSGTPLFDDLRTRNISETLLVLTVLELLQALYQVTVLLVLNFFGKDILNLDHDSQEHANKLKNTLVFNAFVFCQVSPAAISGGLLHWISLFEEYFLGCWVDTKQIDAISRPMLCRLEFLSPAAIFKDFWILLTNSITDIQWVQCSKARPNECLQWNYKKPSFCGDCGSYICTTGERPCVFTLFSSCFFLDIIKHCFLYNRYLSLSSLAPSSQRLDSTGVSGLFPSLLESSGRFLNWY